MKKTWLALCFTAIALSGYAQLAPRHDPAIQPTTGMQYFKPTEPDLFVGDCMPVFHDGTFYVYWLLDEGHHSGLGGLGGHQWAVSTTKDLVNWTHYPVAVGLDEDWEKSICTGSVLFDKGKVYAFFATRVKEDDRVYEHLSYAVSKDGGFTFEKQQPNPFYLVPEESRSGDFRDPKVFKDDEGYHLFVTAYRKEPVLEGMGGYLVHLVSDDLKNWREVEPVLDGQVTSPECSDYFYWNGWYYLIYSVMYGDAHYVKSRSPYGPWEYPESQALIEHLSNVSKTAEFPDGRRIAVSFIPYKDNDNSGTKWGGNMLFREVIQHENGDLGTCFVKEMLPESVRRVTPSFSGDLSGITVNNNGADVRIESPDGVAALQFDGLPARYRMTMTVKPEGNYHQLGVFLRGTDLKNGYRIALDPNVERLSVEGDMIEGVKGMRETMTIDIIAEDEYIDVCYNGERCNINRLCEQTGDKLRLFVKNGTAAFSDIRIYEIK